MAVRRALLAGDRAAQARLVPRLRAVAESTIVYSSERRDANLAARLAREIEERKRTLMRIANGQYRKYSLSGREKQGGYAPRKRSSCSFRSGTACRKETV